MNIITPAQARDQVRSDSTADDADLQIKIDAATDAVIDYISIPITDLFNTNGTPKIGEDGAVVRGAHRVKQAILLTVAWLYTERDGTQDAGVEATHGYGYGLPKGATALLYSMRKPTCA